MSPIQRNKSSNRFCGPAALAALTGLHVDDAARTLRAVSGKPAIKGVAHRHMVAALGSLGYAAVPVLVPFTKRPTLTQALRGVLKDRRKGRRFLVVVTGHYVTIEGRTLVDNKHPDGIALTACPYRRKRVRAAWEVLSMPELEQACQEKHRASQLTQPPPPPPPMTLRQFRAALVPFGLDTNSTGCYIDAPEGYRFQSDLHCIFTGDDYRDALERLPYELPLVACPADCECRDES